MYIGQLLVRGYAVAAMQLPRRLTNRAGALATLVVLGAVYVFLGMNSTLWDRDEPRFSQATLEMLHSHTFRGWMVPTFEGHLRADKPILIYWLQAAAVAVLGVHEIAFRLPSILGVLGACWVTYEVGRLLLPGAAAAEFPVPSSPCPVPGATDADTLRESKIGNRNSKRIFPGAWWAMVMLGTSLMPVVMGTLATADGALLFFLTAALGVFVAGVVRGRLTLGQAVSMGLLLGGAWLTKGPLALLPLASMVMIWGWLSRNAASTPGNREHRFRRALGGPSSLPWCWGSSCFWPGRSRPTP